MLAVLSTPWFRVPALAVVVVTVQTVVTEPIQGPSRPRFGQLTYKYELKYPVADGLDLHEEFLELMQSRGAIEPDEDRLEDGIAFAGVAKFPARVKCALLGWSAFKDAALRASATSGVQAAEIFHPQVEES